VLASLRQQNELRREIFQRDFPGTLLSGSGTIAEIQRCRARSPRYGKTCVEVLLRTSGGRITLVYGAKDDAMVTALNPGAEHSFARCAGISISSYGARCDMP
jgi:hypothetical protein